VGTFGDKLKRERELRGVTLEEIAEATKIGTRSLKALEDEHFDQLPGGIFNKGFVKAYAKFLGLDEEQAVSDFVAAQGEQPASAKADVMAKMAAQAEVSRRSEFASSGGEKTGSSNKIWITAAVLVLLTAGIAAGIRYRKMKQEAAAQAAQPKPAVQQQVQAAPPTLPPSSADASLQNGTPTTDPNATQLTGGTTQPATTNSAATTPATTPPGPGSTTTAAITTAAGSTFTNPVSKPGAPKTTPAATTNPTATPAKGALELQIHVSRATWLSVQADGKEASTETLRDSATKTVVAQDRVVITTGNSVDVTCNGKSLGILGADNKRSQLRISADCKVN
jgi:cytoskeleton protein RodZ